MAPSKPDDDAARAEHEKEKQQFDIDRKSADAADRTAIATDKLVIATGALVHATDRLADFTVYLVFVTAITAAILLGQLRMFWRQLGTMNTSVKHSETVAKTALAALDRPWLFVTYSRHNQFAWTNGDDGLSVVFSLTNYGKAPAIVLSIKGAIFPSPGPRNKISEVGPATVIKESGIVDFPSRSELQTFKDQWARAPRGNTGSVIFRSRQHAVRTNLEVTDAPPTRVESTAYIVPFVVGEKETTSEYWILGRAALNPPPMGIPVQSAMNIYFIGTILYHGPDERIQSIEFCYESSPHGEFKTILGAPYNDRHEAK